MKYLTSTGACTVKELLENKDIKETLKAWAIEEMKNKGIEVTEN